MLDVLARKHPIQSRSSPAAPEAAKVGIVGVIIGVALIGLGCGLGGTSINDLNQAGWDGNKKYCDQGTTIHGTVVGGMASPGDSPPGYNTGYGPGYVLEDNVGVLTRITVIYDPAKSSAPKVGQKLQVAGLAKCSAFGGIGTRPSTLTGPFYIQFAEISRTVQ